MKTLLHIDASPREGERSHSRRLARRFVETWLTTHPGGTVRYRDLRVFTPPHVTVDWIAAAFTPEEKRTPSMTQALAISDLLTDELIEADDILLATPFYNFGLPSVVKAWVDNVVRAGRTFLFQPHVADAPYVPLLRSKRLVVIVATGDAGYEPGGRLWSINFLEPHLRQVAAFIGIEDLAFIYTEADEFGGPTQAESFAAALARVSQEALSPLATQPLTASQP